MRTRRAAGAIVIAASAIAAVAANARAASSRAASSRTAAAEARCHAAYTRLFARDRLDVRVVFGYKDARPARYVGDRYERAVLVQWLLEPCQAGQTACGFARAAEDSELLRKQLPGPDGKPRTVEVRVVASSAGPDDEENRQNPFQKWQSAHARQEFLEGLRDADIVFYNGHSRDGGGPDFAPPTLGRSGHVDYTWYVKTQTGLREMLKAIQGTAASKDAEEGARLLGIFSCASTTHFAQGLGEARKTLGILSSRRLIYFSDALESSRLALGAVLAMKCQPDFDRAIQVRSNQAGTTLLGFFR